MSIASFEQLKDITQDLWRKAKAKIEAIANDYVSKTLPNNVVGEIIFKNGYIEGGILSSFNNKNTEMFNAENGGCFGIPSTSISAGIKVGKIAIAVKDDLAVGSIVSNVVALAVKRNNNEVKESIIQNGTATVFQNQYSTINAQKIVYINIDKTFDEEVYFVIGCTNMLWNTDTPPNRANVYGSSTIPAIGAVLDIQNYHYSGRMIVFSERMSFSEVINIKNNSVSKIKDNILTGKTILQDGYIDGELYSYNNPNIEGAATGNGVYSGTNNKVIHGNQHITSVIIAVDDAFALGSTVTGVNIGVVKHSNNQVMEYIIQNGTSTVIENNYPQSITATKVINVLVNKKWVEDVYLLVGANGMLWGGVGGTPGLTTATGGNRLPSVGSTISNLNRSNYVGRVVALGSNISLNSLTNKVDLSEIGNKANKIPRVLPNGKLDPSILPPEQNGGVRTVNDQSPNQNGNVIVLADHIKYANGQNTTVKQEIAKKINESDAVTSSQANKIVKLDGNGKINENMFPSSIIKSNQDNNFTKHNSFNDYSPTVHRLFTRKHINSNVNSNSNLATYQNNKYFAPVNEVYTDRNKRITHLLLPVRGASIGEQIAIDVFAFNNNKRLIQLGTSKKYPVVEEEIAGCKCVKINFDIDSGTNGIGFGFMIMSTGVGAVCVQGGSNVAWTSNTRPTETTTLNPNENISFPYKICYETTSEVVTRFELENVTQMYPRNMIGEYKNLSYDGGNSLEDGTNTWLKANGQAINRDDYPELYEKFNIDRTNDDIEVSIPSVDNQIGYYYICAK
ncbi:unknown [Clostridium sp. CAG:221]|jgi:ribonucleotide reductase beta subunit family protein with ferritin-like domain|uniref:hypothetical protein n=1 Tax=Clostridium sp. CAG:221 TaxID=1262780 RepID=UPI00033BDB71|nr:hypothetical protein [Clostridium sp. CAG:221]CDB16191.1 unknown [Clostridium sp. CAG:221]